MPRTSPIPIALVEEGQRMASICNACRYCEGYCAVFPAIERRLSFTEGDLAYLANLCHNCGACHYACQYAPPHEFGLDLPRYLADVRLATYRKYAWPDAFAKLYARNGVTVSLVLAAALALFFVALSLFVDHQVLFSAHPDREGAFYAVLPHRAMAWTFGSVFIAALVPLAVGFLRFWNDVGEAGPTYAAPGPLAQSTGDALTLKYLDGGGDGCTYPGEVPSHLRRWFHHFTLYGFMLCFAATSVATIYHYFLGWPAPYPLMSLPVLLGTAGGVGLLIGPAGLLWLKAVRDPALAGRGQGGMDAGFLVLLMLAAATGLALLALRENAAMGMLLAAHLGVILALFLTLPYGKFVHAVYRFAALLRFHVEMRRPPPAVAAD